MKPLNSVACFTCDTDWAPEWLVEKELGWFAQQGVPLQPFLTNESRTVTALHEPGSTHVGLHPYIGPGSTHGDSVEAVAATVAKLWPGARSWRGHRYCDSEDLQRAMHERGCEYDANLFAELQTAPVLRMQYWSSRFLTGWEDEVWFRGPNPDADTQLAVLLGWLVRPGVHVLNVHPQWFGLNLDSAEAYSHAKEGDWDVKPGDGFGAARLVTALVSACRELELPTMYLDDVWEAL